MQGKPIGFVNITPAKDSEELWEGYTALGGSYSIDYMIGETDCLDKGFGKMIVAQLTDRIALHPDAKRIVVQPEPENKASCGLFAVLRFYCLTRKKEIYVKPFDLNSGQGSCSTNRTGVRLFVKEDIKKLAKCEAVGGAF